MKVYVVYEWDRCDKYRTSLKVCKNEADAEKFCKEQPPVYGISYHYEELEAEGFE